jgi:hypothetical protein
MNNYTRDHQAVLESARGEVERQAMAEGRLRRRIAELPEPDRSRQIRRMCEWLEVPSGGYEKGEIAEILAPLGLTIWSLPPDKARAMLDSLP